MLNFPRRIGVCVRKNVGLVATATLCLAICSAPAYAQFSGGTTLVDPTLGAQSLAKFLVDGLLYLAAAGAVVCFFWGIFRLFTRPLEGILEICCGIIVFGLIGHALQWGSALTGVTVG